MDKAKFSTRARCRSFGYAFKGIRLLFAREHNAWIHIVVAVCVVAGGFWLRVSAGEWAVLVFAIGIVLAAEGFNSAIECLADRLHPERDHKIGEVKDIAAGAVLITAVAAAVVGLIVFIPKIISLL